MITKLGNNLVETEQPKKPNKLSLLLKNLSFGTLTGGAAGAATDRLGHNLLKRPLPTEFITKNMKIGGGIGAALGIANTMKDLDFKDIYSQTLPGKYILNKD